MELKGMKAVVIGGTSGIGKALALGMARAGADVAASSRQLDAVEVVADEIDALGVRSLRRTIDVCDRASIESFHQAVLDVFEVVDILINCAGISKRISTLDVDEALWNRIMDVNLNGTFRACQIFGAGMLERGFGRIINIASLSSFVAFQEVTPYSCSKAAVAALTRSLAIEWAPRNVTVNAIAPGIFPTDLNRRILDSPRGTELLLRTPMHRFGEPAELVSTAIYLAKRETTFTTGQIISVDGGFLASGVNQ